MSAVVGRDTEGAYGVIRCDHRECGEVVVVRAGGGGEGLLELAQAVVDQADGAGWRLVGASYCPGHAIWDRPGDATTVGDGFGWVKVGVEAVKGA